MNNTLIDNSSPNLFMVNTIKKCIQCNQCKGIKIATGYWDIPGMALLHEELTQFLKQENATFQLLIGSDPIVRASQLKNPLINARFPDDYIRRDIHDLKVKDELSNVVELLLKYCKADQQKSRIKIRIYKRNENGDANFLHAKCYIFKGELGSCGIIGSSNFTKKGLEDNAELNYLETNSMIVMAEPKEGSPRKGHDYWFDEKWEQAEDWNRVFLEEILKTAPITKSVIKKNKSSLTPYELYIKLLQYRFGDLVDKDSHALLESYLPKDYGKLEYQLDAVNQCFSCMRQHGGFMLADVVGVGKTVIGTLLVKKFLDFADTDGRERKVLIITPPAIKSAWVDTIERFDKEKSDRIAPYVDFITTGSIGKLVDDPEAEEIVQDATYDEADTNDFEETLGHENYGLIIIDESHKFRNSDTIMYRQLDQLISEIGADTGVYPYVGLLSATPQNNRPDDLKNQIYLFQRNRNHCTLEEVEGGNLERFFSDIKSRYREILSSEGEVTMEKTERNRRLKEIAVGIRKTVLDAILVRRTRTDLQKYYKEDLTKQGIVFPQIKGPISLEYKMDTQLANLFYRTMDLIVQNNSAFDNTQFLCYYRYRAIEFFAQQESIHKYTVRNLTPERTSRQLARIMQLLLVKRLESSFTAFKISLHNLQRYTDNMIRMWENNTIFVCPQIDVNTELDTRKHWKDRNRRSPGEKVLTFDECVNDIRRKIIKLKENGKDERNVNCEYTRNDFRSEYIELLRQDKLLIDELCQDWDMNDYDPKLDTFKENLESVLMNPQTNTAGKLVIFSEAIGTGESLKRVIESKGYNTLFITAKNRKDKEQIIRENFDANYVGNQKNEYQIIITTEVLAEGINLHRSNVILNYDTPWNATKLMQRIGRVNRIGSKTPFVYVYNFMPSAEGDAEISLVKKAYTKLQSFHTLFGEDSKVYSEEEEITNYELNRMINGEESPYEKYLSELKRYRNEHPQRYEQIANTNEKLCMTVRPDGDSYFVVKTPKMDGLFIAISQEGKSRILSGIDMYREFKPSDDATAVRFPENWIDIQQKAIRIFQQHLVKLNTAAAKDKAATKAKGVIRKMSENPLLDKESKDLLKAAFTMVNKGNRDIIRIINLIEKRIDNPQNELFEFTQSEANQIIHNGLSAIITESTKKSGEPYIYIGLQK